MRRTRSLKLHGADFLCAQGYRAGCLQALHIVITAICVQPCRHRLEARAAPALLATPVQQGGTHVGLADFSVGTGHEQTNHVNPLLLLP